MELFRLGRALGHFIFALIGLKRILLTNIFQKLSKPQLVGLEGLQTLNPKSLKPKP